jgi:D-3-phosphoglycerate dehydrogenase
VTAAWYEETTMSEIPIVLGSAYQAITDALREELGADALVRDFDASRPLADQVCDVTVLILGSSAVSRQIIDAAPRLRLVHQHGRGLDGLDLAAAAARGVVAANVPARNSVAVAEHALALLLFLAKRFRACDRSVASRILGAPTSLELAGKTLGIIGLGASGSELARIGLALGMRVTALRARPEAPSALPIEMRGPGELHRLLAASDFVSLHAPLDDRTRGMIGRAELEAMKPSAYLINVARAGLIDYEALRGALRDGAIAGAAMDVFWSEPADPADPILGLERFVLTPHVAGFSDASIHQVVQVIAENIRRLGRGEPLARAQR